MISLGDWFRKLLKVKKSPHLRIQTADFLVCTVEGYPKIAFTVENISYAGFLIRPYQEENNPVLTKFISDIAEGKTNRLKLNFYLSDKQSISVFSTTIYATVTSVEKKEGKPPGFAFKVVSRDKRKFRKLYLATLQVVTVPEEQTYNTPPWQKKWSPEKFEKDLFRSYLLGQSKRKPPGQGSGNPLFDLLALTTIEEKQSSMKERRLRFAIYAGILLFFLLTGIITDVISKSLKENHLRSVVETYERETNSKVLFLIHQKKEIGLFGIPFYNYLKIYDAHKLLSDLETIPKEKNITIIIHSPGGELLAGIQIAKALKEWKGEVRAVVPYFAMSAGTLISLAADKIITRTTATFGPIDPQIPMPGDRSRYISAVSVIEASKNKNNLSLNERSMIIDSKKALSYMERFLDETVLTSYPESKRKSIVRSLLYSDRNHDFPFFSKELESLGLDITYEMSDSLKELISLLIETKKDD